MFIDIHTHCLPDIDDGAPNAETAIKMLTNSAEQGVELCYATPHCVLREFTCVDEFIEKRKKSFDSLISKLKGKKISHPKILLGAEVYLDNDISKFEGINKLCLEGTNLMLIELPEGKVGRRFADWIYNLSLLNIHPVIAHVERYSFDYAFFRELEEIGVDFQINAGLFLNFKGRRKLKKLLNLTDKFIVSSDMHNEDKRRCNLLPAYNLAVSKFPDFSDKFFYENAADVLNTYKK